MKSRDRDKITALLKSVATSCDTSYKDPDDAWRKCRHCLALQELDRADIREMLAEFLSETDDNKTKKALQDAFLEGYDSAAGGDGVPDEVGGIEAWVNSETKRRMEAS